MHSIKLNEEKPKLYITQPSLSNPTRTMQSYYHSGNEESETNEQESAQLLEEDNDTTSSKKKSFSEMTIEEKIIYLSSQPFHAPKVNCQIVTRDKTLIGTIEDDEADTIRIKVGSRGKLTSISKEQIEEINLIGF